MRRLSLVVTACAGALATAAGAPAAPRFGVGEDTTKYADDDPVRFDPVGFRRR